MRHFPTHSAHNVLQRKQAEPPRNALRTPTSFSASPRLGVPASILLLALFLGATSANAQTTQPAGPAKTFAPLEKKAVPERVKNALTFTDDEARVLSDIHDGSRQEPAVDAALPILIARVAEIGPLTPRELERLETVHVSTLRDAPEAFRFHPVQVDLFVYRARKVSSSNGLRAIRHLDGEHAGDPYVPDDATVWELTATERDKLSEVHKYPLIVYTTFDPTPSFGPPNSEKNGLYTYETGRVLQGPAIFYRVWSGTGDRDKAVHDYPVIIMWQDTTEKVTTPTVLIVSGLLVMVAAGLWMWIRKGFRRIKTTHFTAPVGPPTPEQEEAAADIDPELRKAVEEYKREQNHGQPPVVDGPVDPALRQAVEQWKKERHHDNDQRPR